MVELEYPIKKENVEIPQELLQGKRHLTAEEIQILIENHNHNDDPTWNNFFVDEKPGNFDPAVIHLSFFSGFVILGRMVKANLKFNDLRLETGIRRSRVSNVLFGDDCVVRNVAYLENYRIGSRNILFNIQEMCCTKHSKFGNGILKKGEPEEHRVWIGVANENEGRAVLAFENMIPADAYIWSHYRDDPKLLQRFKELTEKGNSGELNTFGIVGNDCVIKNTNIIKDTKICDAAYIKGAFKLKNITILSSEQEPSQIGEGVEMVNGILGYGCRVFYQAITVRFVIGRNCQVKYGARLLNSVLGDNSTVSCCEILNNLIFPFHEQHHNSSFLIATTVMGQSNIAAGATIGSNHNSRSPDGEIFAKRGFWPGLCSDFKHNSRFASFCLVSKGSYPNELDIPYPFALVSPGNNGSPKISVIPAWWFMYDMFAITRNNAKFKKRDKRIVRVQNIETDPLAPDTMQETIDGIERLIKLTANYLTETKNPWMKGAVTPEEIRQTAKDFLHKHPDADFTLDDSLCQKKYGAVIFKPVHAYKMYRKILKYFAARTLIDFCHANGQKCLSIELVKKIRDLPLFTEWENVGGQIIPSQKIQELFEKIKSDEISSWDEVHKFYGQCAEDYEKYKVRYSLYVLEYLYSCPIEEFTVKLYLNIMEDSSIVATEIYKASIDSRKKDFTDYYRTMTYRNDAEKEAVIGNFDEIPFLNDLEKQTEQFCKDVKEVFGGKGPFLTELFKNELEKDGGGGGRAFLTEI